MNEEVTILITDQQSMVVQPRAIHCHGTGLQVVSETHSSCETCCCFCTAPTAFSSPVRKDGKAKSVTAIEYYCWRLTQHDGLNVMLHRDRLFQQYVVDACVIMEQQRLKYLRFMRTVSAVTLLWCG